MFVPPVVSVRPALAGATHRSIFPGGWEGREMQQLVPPEQEGKSGMPWVEKNRGGQDRKGMAWILL